MLVVIIVGSLVVGSTVFVFLLLWGVALYDQAREDIRDGLQPVASKPADFATHPAGRPSDLATAR